MIQDPFMSPSISDLPGYSASAVFLARESSVFREDADVAPVSLGKLRYMPWGSDNLLPFDMLQLIENDETLSTCLLWGAQMCYGSGLKYVTNDASKRVKMEVEEWLLDNLLPTYFFGVSEDLKHWGFAVSVIVLSKGRTRIARLVRKEACYCRFAPKDKHGKIPYILYAPWRGIVGENDVEKIPLLDELAPWDDLNRRIENNPKEVKFAVVTRVPTADHTYYPIPYWAALFRSKWYQIKQLIGLAKEAKIKNSAPIKYLVEISDKYFDRLFKAEGITDPEKRKARMVKAKEEILEFLSGAENSGKTWFSTFYVTPDGNECHEVKISKIEAAKEGGDWSTDIQEAVNMICFTMQVHSNLVGSVPGKSQTNNSGSDKRELYTIAQALQKPYRDLLFVVHHLILKFNKWEGVRVDVPFIQLTTLDEHTDAKQVTTSKPDSNETDNE